MPCQKVETGKMRNPVQLLRVDLCWGEQVREQERGETYSSGHHSPISSAIELSSELSTTFSASNTLTNS